MSRTTQRVEDYLTTIYRLEEALGEARVSDIARELRVSVATVSKVLEKLERKDLVKRMKYHNVTLTDKGRAIAEEIIAKHRIAELFLSKVLGFNEVEAHYYAHYMEHLPREIIDKMHELLGHPPTCPHGNPIPGFHVEEKLLKLVDVFEGAKCVVKRLLGELSLVLEFVKRHQVGIGTTMTILSKTSTSIKIAINGEELEIPRRVASLIMVSCN
jgi:DtxR family Mn-dependent transcriptional regulator